MTIRRSNDTASKSTSPNNNNKSIVAHSHGTKARTSIMHNRSIIENHVKENRIRRHHRRSNALLLGNVSIEGKSFSNKIIDDSSSCSPEIPPDSILTQLLSESITETSSLSPTQITPSSSILSSFTSSSFSGEYDDDDDVVDEWVTKIGSDSLKPTAVSVGLLESKRRSQSPPSDNTQFQSDDDSIVFRVSTHTDIKKDLSMISEHTSLWLPTGSCATAQTLEMTMSTEHSWETDETDLSEHNDFMITQPTNKDVNLSSCHYSVQSEMAQNNNNDNTERWKTSSDITATNIINQKIIEAQQQQQQVDVVFHVPHGSCSSHEQQNTIAIMMHQIHLHDMTRNSSRSSSTDKNNHNDNYPHHQEQQHNHSSSSSSQTSVIVTTATASVTCGF